MPSYSEPFDATDAIAAAALQGIAVTHEASSFIAKYATEKSWGRLYNLGNSSGDIDLIVHSISNLYTVNGEGPDGLGLITCATVAFAQKRLVYAGSRDGAPSLTRAKVIIDGTGLCGLPGLIDCHTHSVWAGSRAHEWSRRLAGESYETILEEGGGILSTVRTTRAASLEELIESARLRVRRMRDRCGVTTVEIKSGYGLNPETEEKILKAARACEDTVRVTTTFLGAHTLPKEYRNNRSEYVKQVINEQLPLCAPLSDCGDVFCDSVGFTLDETRDILEACKRHGLSVKAHCEQICHLGGAALVAELGGVSCDHLEQATTQEVVAMAKSDTVAVFLPGAQLYLKDKSPPTDLFRKHGVKMAIGTDLNPGTSPLHDIWTCATLACITEGFTIPEAIKGITRHAGLALGRSDVGWLGEGSVGDLVLFETAPSYPPTVESLVQNIGGRSVRLVVKDGQVVFLGGS